MSLHQAVFRGDYGQFLDLIEKIKPKEAASSDVVAKSPVIVPIDNEWYKPDAHGNTPLHIAVALGRKGMIPMLINAGHPAVTVWNPFGWNPLDDAIAYGDIDTIITLMDARDKEISDAVKTHLPGLLDQFHNTLGDFYMEINMDFHSWVPFLSRLCPRDTFKIWKRGSSVRLDHSLIGLDGGRWLHAKVSTLFYISPEHGPVVVTMNHDKKIKQQVYPLYRLPEFKSAAYSAKTQRKLDILQLVTTPLTQIEITTSKMNVKRHRSMSQNFTSFFRRKSSISSSASTPAAPDSDDESDTVEVSKVGASDSTPTEEICTEKIGKYVTQRYNINDLELVTKLRLEHLTDDRISELGLDTWFANAEEEYSVKPAAKKHSKERENVEKFLRKTLEDAKVAQKDPAYWDKLDIDAFGLAPPEGNEVSFEEYFGGGSDVDSAYASSEHSAKPLNLGREFRIRNHVRPIRVRLWMSGENLVTEKDAGKKGVVFPWKLSQLLTLLDVLDLGTETISEVKLGVDGKPEKPKQNRNSLTPLGQVKNFLRLSGIENGFPVQMEVPMFGIFVAQVRFMDFIPLGPERPTFDAKSSTPKVQIESAASCYDDGFFSVPESYEVGEVFPHLAKK